MIAKIKKIQQKSWKINSRKAQKKKRKNKIIDTTNERKKTENRFRRFILGSFKGKKEDREN